MPVTNANKKVVDLPFAELITFAPFITSATGGLTTAADGSSRYIYYITIVNSVTYFYRYDTQKDMWQRLATPLVAPVTGVSLQYTSSRGYHGRVLSATSSTVEIPGLRGKVLSGEKIVIESGTGKGQERTLTLVSNAIHEFGVPSNIDNANVFTDNTKRWRVNQWAGYTVAITHGNSPTQHKKILYNSTNQIVVADGNLQPMDPWNNQGYSTVYPYNTLSAAAGSQSNYQIMSSTFSVDTPWDVQPDDTSFFTVLTGGIYLLSASTSAPFFTFQYYDIAHDSWQVKTANQGLLAAALGTDFTIERTGQTGGVLLQTTGAISATARTLSDAGLNLTEYDRYANCRIYITGGTGRGQSKRIVAHNENTFTVPNNWDVTPDATSTYKIYADYDRIYMAGNGNGSMLAYSPSFDVWMQGQLFDYGATCNISCTFGEYQPFGVTTGARIAAGVQTVASAPAAGGTGYTIGDVLTIGGTGGAGATVRVTSIAPGGVVAAVQIVHNGTTTGYTTGVRVTTGGTGTGCTVDVTAVGPTALITLATGHFMQTGDVVKFAGCNEAAWNANHTIVGVPSLTTFCVVPTATASMAATASQSTTVVVDPTKNWVTNEHVGRLIHISPNGTAPSAQIRWITANTANTITVNAAITAATNGTSNYVIYDSKVFGADDQYKQANKSGWGYADSGTTTTLVDNSKDWIPDQWAGYSFKVEAGTGYGSGRIAITSNTATTLTFATQTFTPDSTTKYEIADTWGLCTASTTSGVTEAGKKWLTNHFGARRVRITSGTGVGSETTCNTNTATVLTNAAVNTDNTSTYAILSLPARSSGIKLVWAYNPTTASKKGRYMYLPRGGGSTQIDIYDISTQRWSVAEFFSPQSQGFGTGWSYSYDGNDGIYMFVWDTAWRLNVETNEIVGAFRTTTANSSSIIGNFTEIITTEDGLKYMYYLHGGNNLGGRVLLF